MPVIVKKGLPCAQELRQEGQLIFEGESIADLRIGLLNLMPEKVIAERQFARRLGRDDVTVSLDLLKMESQQCQTSDPTHIDKYYSNLTSEKLRTLDGLIITGAPVEKLRFEEVDYWHELVTILGHVKQMRLPNLLICWAAQASLYHHYGIEKTELPKKAFGVFRQNILNHNSALLAGISKSLTMPVSRHTTTDYSQLFPIAGIKLVAGSTNTGPALLEDEHSATSFLFNHLEYEADTLNHEYQRDMVKGLNPDKPVGWKGANLWIGRDDTPWQHQGSRLYFNWLDQVIHSKAEKRIKPDTGTASFGKMVA
jgi:homoserine O-succinyltransferase